MTMGGLALAFGEESGLVSDIRLQSGEIGVTNCGRETL